jgi:hypothetical protein
VFTIYKQNEVLNIQPGLLKWYADTSGSAIIEQYKLDITKQPAIRPDVPAANYNTWSNFVLKNNTSTDKEYFLQTKKTGVITCWVKSSRDSVWKESQSGSLLKLKDRSLHSNTNGIVLQVNKNEPLSIVLKFESGYSIYNNNDHSLILAPLAVFERQDSQRLLWQGLFLGIILVMAFYNLIIFFAVKDFSYLYYVLSLIGIGLYFSFYYGIGIEYLWPNAPLWDTYCFILIINSDTKAKYNVKPLLL